MHLAAAYEMPAMDIETEDTAVLRAESSPTNRSKRKREPSPDATWCCTICHQVCSVLLFNKPVNSLVTCDHVCRGELSSEWSSMGWAGLGWVGALLPNAKVDHARQRDSIG